MEILLGLAELGPAAVWIICAAAAVAAVFVVVFLVYLGCALVAIWRCPDPQLAEIRYRAFRDLVQVHRDLVGAFRRRRR